MHSPEQEGKTEPKMIFPELLTLHLVNSVSQFHFLNGTPSFTLFRVRPFSSYLMDTSPYISGHFRGN